MLKHAGRGLEGMRVAISGAGNVAQFTIEKTTALGAKVVTVADSSGTVIDEDGFTTEKLAVLGEVKNHLTVASATTSNGRAREFVAGATPWHVPADVAMPSATQNELGEEDEDPG